MTSSPHGPYGPGLHTCYNGGDKGCYLARGANPKKPSQFGLQSATRLHEVGIASNRVDQHATVNTFPGLVHTARHTMGVGFTRSRCANIRRQPSTVGSMTGVKS